MGSDVPASTWMPSPPAVTLTFDLQNRNVKLVTHCNSAATQCNTWLTATVSRSSYRW